MSKPPIFHPYTTNTGQVLLTELVTFPAASIIFNFVGGDNPVAPVQIETLLPELLLLVYPSMDIIVGWNDFVPSNSPGQGVPQTTSILLIAAQWYLLQWPSQFFTPVPLTDPGKVFINKISAQNSTGDPYKLQNR